MSLGFTPNTSQRELSCEDSGFMVWKHSFGGEPEPKNHLGLGGRRSLSSGKTLNFRCHKGKNERKP